METSKPILLPVKLHPANLRPIAYRILSKKHGLNIQTESLKILADYIGFTFGNNWKGLKSQEFMDNLGKLWKEQGRSIFLDPLGVDSVIKELNGLSEPKSAVTGVSKKLELSDMIQTVNDKKQDIEIYNDDASMLRTQLEAEHQLNWKDFFQVIPANKQANYRFDPIKKQYEKEATNLESLKIASIKSKMTLHQTRYAVVELRLSRNSNFRQPTFSSLHSLTGSIKSSAVTITAIKNLLGRHGQRFVLFGLLTKNEAGSYSLEDDSDKIELDVSQCIPTEGSHYCPGFFVIVEGIYSNSNKFYCSTIGHPPLERRDVTLDAYGNIDFLGVHASSNLDQPNLKNLISSVNGVTRINKALKKNLQLLERELHHHKLIVLGHDCDLQDTKKLEALKRLFQKLTTDLQDDQEFPFCIVFSGPFSSEPFTASPYFSSTMSASSSSTQYKQSFDSLASLLEKFPLLCSKVTMIFVPGDKDPWSSVYNKGSSVMWPQSAIPKVFTNRLKRLVKNCHFVSNPTKLNYLNHEIVIFRDDLNARLKRNSINFNPTDEKGKSDLSIDNIVRDTPIPTKILEARKLVKTILDQGHLSPFENTTRPIIWDKDYYLTMSPLPSVVFLNDPTISEFDVTYEGCHFINPGPLLTRGQLNYVEYWPSTNRSIFKQI